MSQILCSTGALIGMPNGRNHKLLETFAQQLACDGFEFMMYSTWYDRVEELVADLLGLQLNIPVMHCDKRISEGITRGETGDLEEAIRLFTINCDIARRLGARKMVFHLWNGLISDSNMQNNISAYKDLAQIARAHQVDLLVENVVCNHQDPLKHWCSLAEVYPHIHFIFDTKMAAFHGQLEQLYSQEYAWLWQEGHIAHYHVNDYAGGYLDWNNLRTLPIGRGHIDFDQFFEFIRRTGYDHTFTVEATAFNGEGIVDIQMLNGCFEKIRQYLAMQNG